MVKNKTKRGIALAIAGAFFFAFFGIFRQRRACADNPYGWERISSYTTYFNQEDRGRCENIAIAAGLIDGATVQAYGEFSFNQWVGRRTAEAGYQQEKIIVDGE